MLNGLVPLTRPFLVNGEDGPLWKRIMRLKYGVEEGGWFIKDGRGAYGVDLWKEIKKEPAVLKQYSNFDVGDGRRICF